VIIRRKRGIYLKKKWKIILGASIGINIILLLVVIFGLIKINFVKEQVLVTEVQQKLIELEGLIAYQSEQRWSEPNLVTTQLRDVLNGIWFGITTGEQLGNLTKEDRDTLSSLYSALIQYPNDELYRFVEVTEEDQKKFEELREILREAGLGLHMTISPDSDSLLSQAEDILEKLTESLEEL
jgi:hypothetical protein